MTQVNLPTELLKQVLAVMDNHPLYRSLGLDNRTAYVREALRIFVECNGECYRKVIREETGQFIDKIKDLYDTEKSESK